MKKIIVVFCLFNVCLISCSKKNHEVTYYFFPLKRVVSYEKNDSAYVIEYYKNGRVKEFSVADSNSSLVYVKTYCENGHLIDVSRSDSSSYHYIKYHCNGKIAAESDKINSTMIGLYKQYYENGNLQVMGMHSMDYINKPYQQEGLWTYYNEDGSVDYIGVYLDGKLIRTQK